MQRIEPHDRRSLSRFGIALAFMLVLVFGVAGPWLFGRGYPAWPWVAAGVLVLAAAAWPRALYPVHRVLAPPLRLLAAVNNRLLLGLVFFLLVWPYGVFARLTGRLHYRTGFDPGAATYRIRRSGPPRRDGPTDLDQPF